MYRNDIDGLRSIAIIPVLLYHFGFPGFNGGYVGVDVFFVISGFLITKIIAQEIQQQKFSIINFYERRIRRIFPAFFAVIFTCLLVSYFIMLPGEIKDFGQSLVASTLFSSNILFWIESGYFDAEVLVKPLLHTWSLSVEEQYYLIFPVLLFLLLKHSSKSSQIILLAFVVISLGFSIWAAYNAPIAGFFLIFSRFYELLIGSLLALYPFHKSPLSKMTYELLAVIGIAAIFYSVIFFDHSTPFPSYYALIPCIGTAVVIYAGTNSSTFIGKFLSLPTLTHIGKLSYSLYLWHWPIYVFTRLYLDRQPSLLEAVGLLIFCYLISLLSWKFIETPFRKNRLFWTRKKLFWSAASAIIFTASLGATLHITQGLPSRLSMEAQKVAETINMNFSSKAQKCLNKSWKTENANVEFCSLSEFNESPIENVIWGDSHAASIAPAFSKGHFGFAGMQGCPPLIGEVISHGKHSFYDDCVRFNNSMLDTLTRDSSIKTVYLGAYWVLYTEGIRLESDPNHGDIKIFFEDHERSNEISNNAYELKQSLSKTIDKLESAGKKVKIIGPIPELDINGASSIARHMLLNKDKALLKPERNTVNDRIKQTIRLLSDVHAFHDVEVFYPHEILCNNAFCEIMIDGLPIYSDRHHLTINGAQHIVNGLFDITKQ